MKISASNLFIEFYLHSASILFVAVPSTISATIPDQCGAVYDNLNCPFQNLCSSTLYTEVCHCDDLCGFYEDCCPFFTPKGPTSLEHVNASSMSCVKEKVGSSSELDMYHVYMIDSCPKGFNDIDKRNSCEVRLTTQSLLSSVLVSDNFGILYRNVFCALCNGVLKENVIFWRSKVQCKEAVNITQLENAMKTWKCHIGYYSHDNSVSYHECDPDYIKTCPVGYQDQCTKLHCENSKFIRLIFDGTTVYKNEHCASCNGYEPFQSDYRRPFICSRPHEPHITGPPPPISILIDLDINGGAKVGYTEEQRYAMIPMVRRTVYKSCDKGYVFDIIKNECVLLYCSPGLIHYGQKCLSPENETSVNVASFLDEPGNVFKTSRCKEIGNGTFGLNNVLNVSQCEEIGNRTDGLSSPTNDPILEKKFGKADAIVSLVGQCISIIGLVIHLVVYSVLPQLRSLPGKSLMALVSCLLVAQVLFLFGVRQTDPYELCVAIGVLIHYSFLASFFWMGIMSFDIWVTFSESSSISGKHNRKFLNYCLVAFGGPLVIVITSLVINFIGIVPEDFKPGYGEGLCWIVHRKPLIIFFGTPVFSLVFINILFYCLTLRALYRTSRQTRLVRNDAGDRQRFITYLKLSTVMGLTWIFGLVAVLADVKVLWYIFLIFNSLQGAFICIAFVFTKKVFRLLRVKFKCSCCCSKTAIEETSNDIPLSNSSSGLRS